MTSIRALAAAALLGLAAASPAAAVTVLAAPPGAACDLQAGCMTGANTYVRVIPAGAFTGGQNIASLLFDRAILAGREGAMFRVSFWTGDGAERIGDFGSFVVSVLPGQEVTLSGDDFWYDPAWGDLMIRVDIAAPSVGGAGGFLTQGAPQDDGFQLVGEDGPPLGQEGEGDPRPPGQTLVSAAPEPGAWALMIAGFGGAGVMLRRRRALPI